MVILPRVDEFSFSRNRSAPGGSFEPCHKIGIAISLSHSYRYTLSLRLVLSLPLPFILPLTYTLSPAQFSLVRVEKLAPSSFVFFFFFIHHFFLTFCFLFLLFRNVFFPFLSLVDERKILVWTSGEPVSALRSKNLLNLFGATLLRLPASRCDRHLRSIRLQRCQFLRFWQ